MNVDRSTTPVVTVVTVVFNAQANLEATLLSVLSQDCPGLEYLIIDGGSTDGTLEIVRRHEARLSGWISEPDAGIYDAMNKGLRRARGTWVHFLNAGDRFAAPDVLRRCLEAAQPGDGVLYGDCLIEYDPFQRLVTAKGPEHLTWGLPFSHQAVLVRRDTVVPSGFDLGDGTAADYGMMASLKQRGVRFRHVPLPIAVFKAGGISDVKRLASLWHTFLISGRCFGFHPRTLVHFAGRFLAESLKTTGRRVLGPYRMARLRSWKYRQFRQQYPPS